MSRIANTTEKPSDNKPAKLTRQEQARQTRKKIFDVAYKLLQERDISEISIHDIVTAAGVSTGTFYLYFSTKLDVYYQTYVLADAYFLEHVQPQVQSGTTLERLMTFFSYYALYNSDYSSIKLTRLLYNGENRHFHRADDGMRTILMDILKWGLNSGELDPSMTKEELAEYLMDMARGTVYDWCISDGSYNLEQRMKTHISRLYKSISRVN